MFARAQIETPADLGQEREERPHQEADGHGHSVVRARDHGHERVHELHHVPRRPQEDPRHQAALPRHDHQERKCRVPGPRAQLDLLAVRILANDDVARLFLLCYS